MGHKVKQSLVNSRIDFFYYAFRNILLVSIPLVIISTLILGFISHSSASTDQIEFSLSVSCTMSSVVNTAHTKEITNGTYHSDVGKTTITALCNDGNGYTVYATGYSNNEVGNNKLINTTNSQYSINTGLATSGLTSTWAMKLNNLENDPSSTPPIIESAYDDTYGLVPNNWTKVASRQSGTTDMNLGSSFTTTYSIYTSSSQFAGTYRGQVKYALLHPYSNSNTLSFDSFDQAFAFYEKEKVTITDPITGQTGSYYTMQGMDSNICSLTNTYGEASATQLVDIRDNKLYWVAKLDDEHCWMTQNLDLDLSHETALTSETSDIDPDAYNTGVYTTANGYNIDSHGVVSWLPSTIVEVDDGQGGTTQAQRANTLPMNWTSATAASIPNWTNNNNKPYSADAGNRYKYTNNAGNETVYTSLEACHTATNDMKGCQHMHLGNYYNWTSAVATNNTGGYNSGTLANSICPKNWDLPANGKYSTLLSTEGVTTNYNPDGFLKIRTSPLYFVRLGRVNGGSLSFSANFGYYWSGTVNGANWAYLLSFGSSDASPSYGNDDRYNGGFVRCMTN